MPGTLESAFFAALPADVRARLDLPIVRRELRERFDAARARWPQVALPEAVFGAFLAERVGPDASPPGLAGLAVDELYLGCACARGDAEALRLVETHHLPKARAALLAMRLPADVIDEVLQRLRAELFVDPGDGRPRILQFRGRGTLGSWLSVSAVRAAYKILQRETREQPNEDERLAGLTVPGRDQEASYASERYREAFRLAFAAALRSLDDRDKNLLRQHYLDQLPIERLATLYRTHRATAARRLAMARQQLRDRTRSQLMELLRVPLAECDSIIRLVKSQFDLTVHRLFAAIDPT